MVSGKCRSRGQYTRNDKRRDPISFQFHYTSRVGVNDAFNLFEMVASELAQGGPKCQRGNSNVSKNRFR